MMPFNMQNTILKKFGFIPQKASFEEIQQKQTFAQGWGFLTVLGIPSKKQYYDATIAIAVANSVLKKI